MVVATPDPSVYEGKMRRRRIVVGAAVFLVLLGGAGAWYQFLRPDPKPPAPVEERSYEEIERADYEKWMQDLGYTE